MAYFGKMKIIDVHLHFYDYQVNKHPFLEETDPHFVALIGDYSALPRAYLLQHYLEDSKKYQVEGVVWHEFVSTDPIQEVKWAHELSQASPLSQAMVVSAEFHSPDLREKLEFYSSVPGVVSVREHLLWHKTDSAKRLGSGPDMFKDPSWVKGLEVLRNYPFKCALVVFASQIPELFEVIKLLPEIQFTLPLMGWPDDLSKEGFAKWKNDIRDLRRCENLCVSISAMECIFGMQWSVEQIRPWILEVIEVFGTNRCMFGSHMPIGKLSRGFQEIYKAYDTITASFSESEKERLFYRTAADWFFPGRFPVILS
jgi:predicted TIM-barrel fold metal-dependent hydrolase